VNKGKKIKLIIPASYEKEAKTFQEVCAAACGVPISELELKRDSLEKFCLEVPAGYYGPITLENK